MKLNLGSNDVRYEGFLNVDIRNIEAVDIVDDVSLLSSIEDESVEHIIAHNILEHFAQDRVQDVIKIWVQKLKKDGLCVIGVPDGLLIFNRYLSNQCTRKEYMEEPWEDVIHSIFGNIKKLREWHGDDAEYYMHHTVFNESYLTKLMERAGLGHIKKERKNQNDCICLSGRKL